MVNQGVVSVNEVTEGTNNNHVDVKRALKLSFKEIRDLISQFASPNKPLIIDGKEYWGDDKFSPAVLMALQDKMEQLQNRSTTILSIFDILLKLESKLLQ